LAAYLDRLVHLRQTCRGHHAVGGNLALAEDARPAGAHVSRRNIDPHVGAAVHIAKINLFDQQIPQWVKPQRVQLVTREHSAEVLEEKIARRIIEAVVSPEFVPHAAADWRKPRGIADGLPESAQRLARAFWPATLIAVRQHHGAHRPSAGSADPADRQSP